MPLYDEQISFHEPIHDDAILWEDFMELIKSGEYAADKVYFISDVDTQKQLLERLLLEIYNAMQQLEATLGDDV